MQIFKRNVEWNETAVTAARKTGYNVQVVYVAKFFAEPEPKIIVTSAFDLQQGRIQEGGRLGRSPP